MANFINFSKSYDTTAALENVFNYVLNKNRTAYVGAQNMSLTLPFDSIYAVRNFYDNQTKITVLHFGISFAEDEYISLYDMYLEGYNICSIFPDFQIAFAVHNDTEHRHLHFAIHPINIRTGKKLYFDNKQIFYFLTRVREYFNKYDIRIKFLFGDK